MAQSFAMECPVTPERVDQCPATPDFVRRPIKSPENTSSSDESTFLATSRTTSGSPPPNCAICLGKCKNKCFTDSCLHQFCFKCLLEWSKVKAECPLCKQSFKSIIHNVKSDDQFEEYLVQSPPNNFPDLTLPMRAHMQIPNSTMRFHPSSLSSSVRALRSNISTRFRRYVYDGALYALPLSDVTGRFRECSARFYRENPSQIHRLMPWLNRELVCLLRDTNNTTSTVFSMVHDLLTIFNINSPDFRRRVSPYLGQYTAHFIHEFLNFSRSPYDMIGYDREVRYAINSNDEVIINATSSSSDSDDVAEVASDNALQSSRQTLSHSRRQRNNNNLVAFANERFPSISAVHILIGDGDSNGSHNSLPNLSRIPNEASSSQLMAINLSTNNNSSEPRSNETNEESRADVRILNNTPIEINETIPSTSHDNDDRISLLSSASSDNCEFVLEKKPPHLRTPEMVSLNSDSDSDVVFVGEQKKEPEETVSAGPVAGTSGTSYSSLSGIVKYHRRNLHMIRGIFMPSSEVDHSSDLDFKPALESRKSRSIKNRPRKNHPRKLRSRTIKNELDAGPSTSSGMSGGKPMSLLYSSSSRNRRRKQSEPKTLGNRDRPCSGRGYKAIYESSTSSDSDSSGHESDDDDYRSSTSDMSSKTDAPSESNSRSSSSNTSSSTESSSDCTLNSSKKKSKHQTSNENCLKLLTNKNNPSTSRSIRSSSSSLSSHSSSTNKNIDKSRSSSNSSNSSSTSRPSSSSSSSSSSSNSASSKTSDNTSVRSNKKHESSQRKKDTKKCEKVSSKRHQHQESSRSSRSKSHSIRHTKKDRKSNSEKIKKKSKKNKKSNSKAKTKSNSLKKRDPKNKKQKEKNRKRKLPKTKSKNLSTTEFSDSDAEPLAKHARSGKNESCFGKLRSSESSGLNSFSNDLFVRDNVSLEQHMNDSSLQEDCQATQELLLQQAQHEPQPSTSELLCFPNQMPINLSTTEQIQSEPPPSPLLSIDDSHDNLGFLSEQQN